MEQIGEDDYKLRSMRAAYFIYLQEKQYEGEGVSYIKLHESLKATYLLKFISLHYERLERMEKLTKKDEKRKAKIKPIVEILSDDKFMDDFENNTKKLLSLADGGIVDYPIMKDYFDAVKNHFNDLA